MNHVYTIGHSLLTFEAFRALLGRYDVDVLVDVRSRPSSGRAPQFNAEALRRSCADSGLRYLLMGEELGGRTDDPSLLVDGRVAYERMAQTERFRRGLDRVFTGARDYTIALMCAERHPLQCHRTLLVARHLAPLLDPGAEVRHILADGTFMTQSQAERELKDKFGFEDGPDLFEPDDASLARAYELQSREVAWSVREGGAGEGAGERP